MLELYVSVNKENKLSDKLENHTNIKEKLSKMADLKKYIKMDKSRRVLKCLIRDAKFLLIL